MVDPGMATWAQVVLLQDHPRPYERVQAYRILTPLNPMTYSPRLARALADLVDGFSPGAPHAGLLTEAATVLRHWAATVDVRELLDGGRNRRAADRDGPDWDLLAASLALAGAGRGDAALTVAEELVACERRRAHTPEGAGRLAVALDHQAALLSARSRSRAAADLRAEAAALRARAAPVRSNGIAALLLEAAADPAPETPRTRRAALPPSGAPSRTPMPHR